MTQQSTGNMPTTQLIAVQTPTGTKQIQSTSMSVPQFQQVFKQVNASGQVISSTGQLLQISSQGGQNVLTTKPLTLQTITTAGGTRTSHIISASNPSSIITVPVQQQSSNQTVHRYISVNPSSIGLRQPVSIDKIK